MNDHDQLAGLGFEGETLPEGWRRNKAGRLVDAKGTYVSLKTPKKIPGRARRVKGQFVPGYQELLGDDRVRRIAELDARDRQIVDSVRITKKIPIALTVQRYAALMDLCEQTGRPARLELLRIFDAGMDALAHAEPGDPLYDPLDYRLPIAVPIPNGYRASVAAEAEEKKRHAATLESLGGMLPATLARVAEPEEEPAET